MNGTLTMLGEVIEVAIPCAVEVTDAGLSANADFRIDRTQWGMTHGKGRIDDDVEIAARFVVGRVVAPINRSCATVWPSNTIQVVVRMPKRSCGQPG